MNDLFRPFIDEFVLVYLDDILVFSKSWNEHVCHVKKVLDVLKKEKLYVKLSKCEFGKTSLVYLGHIVGHGQLYPTYDKELYALVQSVKKWKHYLIGKETIIHTDHQPLQYLQSQTKLQQSRHFRWMGFLQQFHLVIKYKKGTSNKVVDMLSHPPISASVILHNASLSFESYAEQYVLTMMTLRRFMQN
jgi:hypothetical protein